MMNLNTENGKFQFGKWTFTTRDELSDFQSKETFQDFELWISNGPWITYRLKSSEKFILLAVFYEGMIESIEIYPKNLSGSAIEGTLKETLKGLGGPNNYVWGRVELSIDRKAGYKSIVIFYNK